MSAAALVAIDRIVGASEDADEVLRDTVRVLSEEPSISWAGIAFSEGGELTVGPAAGIPHEARRQRTTITYQGVPVGELWVDGEADSAFLSRVAELLAAHVLIGWDTGGEAWEP